MDGIANTKMINGRVNQRSAEKAARILEEAGLTVSAFIRNSIDYVAQVGEVPQSGFPLKSQGMQREHLHALIADLESRPMPGRPDYAQVDEDEFVEQLRMERYGY